MKQLFLFVLCFIMHPSTYSQTVYLADTGFVTDIGFGGAPASCVFKPGGGKVGLIMDNSTIFRLADTFTVPVGSTWTFDTVVIYGYQIGSTTISPFTAGYLRIYKDDPENGVLVWGDSVTNVMVNTGFTGIYRVDTTLSAGGLNSNQRPIMFINLHLSPAPVLNAGGYWLVWSASASGSGTIACPVKVSPGRVNPANQHASQRYPFPNGWLYLVDASQYVGFSKIIKASASLAVEQNNNAPKFVLQIRPNPADEWLEITGSDQINQNSFIMIYDAIGRVVFASPFQNHGSILRINTSSYPQGVYFCKLISAGTTITEKIQVIH
jgi:hypothetical protein